MEYLHSEVYHFGKLFQACQAAAEELFRTDGLNEFHRELTPLSSYVACTECLEVQVVPSVEVRMIPGYATM